jgi:LmeA-like phospholipid-binding
MFGGLTGLKTPPGADFGEQMLNKVVSQSIRHLFTQSDTVDVVIRCNPSSKLLQGSIDNFKMRGCGLLIRRDFWVEEMEFETDAVSIDFSSVLGGKIRLKQPTQAVAQIVLTEAGINRAFCSELVVKWIQNVDDPALTELSGGEPVSFDEIQINLLPENGVRLLAKADLPNGAVPISLTATLAVERRRRIVFQNPQFNPEPVPEALQGISQVLTMAFAGILDKMVDLDRFDLDGVMLRVNRLETQGDKLLFSGYAQIDHFPSMG